MSFIDDIRAKVTSKLRRPFRALAAEWERMPPRERRWVTGLGIAVAVVATALGIILVFTTIGDLEEGNADIREALTAIAKHRDDYLDAKTRAQAQETRLGGDPPQLVADIEAAAREESVQIAESNERPAVPAGKRWIEHEVDLKIRGVDLQALTKFLRRVETGPRPIFFTQLAIKHRFTEADKLDAELTARAFERVKETAAGKKKADAAGAADSDGSGSGAGKKKPAKQEAP